MLRKVDEDDIAENEVEDDDVEEDEDDGDNAEDEVEHDKVVNVANNGVEKEEGDDVKDDDVEEDDERMIMLRKMKWRMMMLRNKRWRMMLRMMMMMPRGRRRRMLRMMMSRRRKMMILRMLMWRRRTDPKTAPHGLCEHAQSTCASTCYKNQCLNQKLHEQCRGPQPRTTLCASLRSRNAHQQV